MAHCKRALSLRRSAQQLRVYAWALVLLLLAALAPAGEGTSGHCAIRGTCVSKAVCNCAVGTEGCEPGSDMCPFPADGAPCLVSGDDDGAKPVQPHPRASAPASVAQLRRASRCVGPQAAQVAPGIEKVCPEVFNSSDLVCCAEDQLEFLEKQLAMAQGILASCPACWANFRRLWCTFTCSPSQVPPDSGPPARPPEPARPPAPLTARRRE
jgi:hypothetical protein